MKKILKVVLLGSGLQLLALVQGYAQATYQAYASDFLTFEPRGLLLDASGTAISSNGQGFRIQIGYFNGQTINNFSTALNGEFVPLLSFQSTDTAAGQVDRQAGTFEVDFTLSSTQAVRFAPDEPGDPVDTFPITASTPTAFQAGVYLALRWYDSADTSGAYNTLSVDAWKAVLNVSDTAPQIETISFFFQPDEFEVALESGEDPYTDGLRASIPEPGFGALAGAGLALLMFARRGRRQVA